MARFRIFFGNPETGAGAQTITGAGAIASAEAFGTAKLNLFIGGNARLASDDFNRADGSPGANWTALYGPLLKIAGNAITGNAVGDFGFMYWNAASFPGAQYSRIRYTALDAGNGNFLGVGVRGSAGPNVLYIFTGNGGLRVDKVVAGVRTEGLVAGLGSVAVGDLLEIRAIGAQVTFYKNGSLIGSYTITDAALLSGTPGIISYHNSSATKGDDWDAGSAIGAGAIASAETFGAAKLNLSIVVAGIAGAEAFGLAKLNLRVTLTGIPSAEAFGAAKLNLRVSVTGIASAQAFGNATLTQPGVVIAAVVVDDVVVRAAVILDSVEARRAITVDSLFARPAVVADDVKVRPKSN